MKPKPATVLAVLLGLTFIWAGLHKFSQPGYWVMWLPPLNPLKSLAGDRLIFLLGALELLLGGGLIVPGLRKPAAVGASLFLGLILLANGIDTVTFRDLGLLGGTIYLAATEHPPGWMASKLRLPGRLALPLLAILLGIGVLLSAALQPPASSPSQNAQPGGQPILRILAPEEGQALARGNVEVRVQFLMDPRKLGLEHLHVELDGNLVQFLYLVVPLQEVVVRVRVLEPGVHTLTVSLAYADHTEPPWASASVNFVITP